jgi:hypothetical protein
MLNPNSQTGFQKCPNPQMLTLMAPLSAKSIMSLVYVTLESGQLKITGFLDCPSSGILKTREHNVSETGSVSVLR